MIAWTVLSMAGCKVVDAPDNLEELMVYAFVNFEGDEKEVEAAAEALFPLVEQQLDGLTEGYRVNDLTMDDLAAAGVDAPDVSGIVGAMGIVDYGHLVEPVMDTASAEDKDVKWPEKFLNYAVQSTTDRTCFFGDRSCESLEQQVYEVAAVAGGEATRTYWNALRWVPESESVPEAIVVRTLSPDPVDLQGSIFPVNVLQQYSLAFVYEYKGHARRVEAFWVDAEVVGMDVPDTIAVDTAVGTMGDQACAIDAFLAGDDATELKCF